MTDQQPVCIFTNGAIHIPPSVIEHTELEEGDLVFFFPADKKGATFRSARAVQEVMTTDTSEEP